MNIHNDKRLEESRIEKNGQGMSRQVEDSQR